MIPIFTIICKYKTPQYIAIPYSKIEKTESKLRLFIMRFLYLLENQILYFQVLECFRNFFVSFGLYSTDDQANYQPADTDNVCHSVETSEYEDQDTNTAPWADQVSNDFAESLSFLFFYEEE